MTSDVCANLGRWRAKRPSIKTVITVRGNARVCAGQGYDGRRHLVGSLRGFKPRESGLVAEISCSYATPHYSFKQFYKVKSTIGATAVIYPPPVESAMIPQKLWESC